MAKYKSPKNGYVINDGTYGTIFIGKDDVKDSGRSRQIEIHSASDATIKLFEDGGFEIQSQPSSKLADNIHSQSIEGLNIKAKNIHLDAGSGEITLSARSIRFQSTGNDQPFVIDSASGIKMSAADTIRLDASVIGIGARTRMMIASRGPIFMKGNGGVTIVEPKQKLFPTSLGDVLNTLISNLFPDYF